MRGAGPRIRRAVAARPLAGCSPMAAYAAVAAAMLFNTVLCAASTRGVHVSLALIAGCEVATVTLALLLAWRVALRTLLVPGVLVTLCVAGLWLMDATNDPKIVVELGIIGGFACLGMAVGDQRGAHLLVWMAALLVLGVGLWEMFALPSFERVFDIYGYYVSKGTLSAAHAGDTGTRLAENGVRPAGDGRQLFPGLLGLHRVGSVFLEPISAGNFTVICVAWVLARGKLRRDGWLLMLVALTIGVLADDRFSVVSSAAVAMMLLSGAWRSRVLVAALPFAMLALLLTVGLTSTAEVDNSIGGRLVGSGRLLADWPVTAWLGLTAPGSVSADTGYSYVIGDLGIVTAAALWLVAALRRRGAAAARMFAAIAVYFTLSLSTSSSCLSIKTAALLWFLSGTLAGETARTRSSARTP